MSLLHCILYLHLKPRLSRISILRESVCAVDTCRMLVGSDTVAQVLLQNLLYRFVDIN